MNGHVIQVLRRVVRLEITAATELKPCIWTRIVFVLRLHLKFKMQQCGCSLRLRYLAINIDTNKINETFYQDILSDSLCSTMTVVLLFPVFGVFCLSFVVPLFPENFLFSLFLSFLLLAWSLSPPQSLHTADSRKCKSLPHKWHSAQGP